MEKSFTKRCTLMAKGVAILLLLIYHLFENQTILEEMQVEYAPFTKEHFLMFSGFGNICVAVFVFLTAYGIAVGLLEKKDITPMEAMREAALRFARLMGNFLILFVSVNVLWWRHFDYASLYGRGKQAFVYLLTDALGLSMFFDTPTLNMTWWYMEIAYLLIFLVPVLVWAVRRVGNYLLLLAFFAPFVIGMGEDIGRYFFVAAFGVCAAYGKWPDKLLNLKIPLLLQWIGGLLLFVLCIMIRQNYVIYETYVYLADAPIALFLVCFASALPGRVPVLNRALELLGRHSMNIYLVHTFFYMMLWRKQIYHFSYWLASLGICLLVCLLYSLVLEGLKWSVRMGYSRIRHKHS